MLGIYVVFSYQAAKGLSQITYVSQSNAHFLRSQPLADLWLDDLTPSHLGGWDWRLLLRLAEGVVFKVLAKHTQLFATERLKLW